MLTEETVYIHKQNCITKEPDETGLVTMPALFCLELLFTLLDVFSRHSSSQDCIPVNEEWLREIGLDPDNLKLGRDDSEHHENNVEEKDKLDDECHDNQHCYR